MKVTMLNVDKKHIKNINNNTKYVLISNDYKNVLEYLNLSIKPILILYNGSYVIDLENNSVIINKPIDMVSLNKINNYASTHNVDVNTFEYQDNVYGLKLTTSNFHRRLIIPYMFSDLLPKVKCNTINKEIFINNNKASLLNAIEVTLNYLNIKNNYIDLENLYINISNDGYYKKELNWKGYEIYES